MRVMAVDPGSKRVGLAMSDPTGTIAQALATIPAEPAATLPARLTEVARAHEAQRIVVGLPLRLDGTHGPEAAAARRLAHGLRQASGLPVEMVDERLTTAAAERSLIAGGVRRDAAVHGRHRLHTNPGQRGRPGRLLHALYRLRHQRPAIHL